MILGLGLDTIDIRRIEKTLERFGTRFTERVFTETERRKADGRATRAVTYAKRFAAKEATATANCRGPKARGGRLPTLAAHMLSGNTAHTLSTGGCHITHAHNH